MHFRYEKLPSNLCFTRPAKKELPQKVSLPGGAGGSYVPRVTLQVGPPRIKVRWAGLIASEIPGGGEGEGGRAAGDGERADVGPSCPFACG